jgi:hypothetical protein
MRFAVELKEERDMGILRRTRLAGVADKMVVYTESQGPCGKTYHVTGQAADDPYVVGNGVFVHAEPISPFDSERKRQITQELAREPGAAVRFV